MNKARTFVQAAKKRQIVCTSCGIMEETPPRDVIFLKKKLAFLCAQVLVLSCIIGCERAPYCPTAWDVLTAVLPRFLEITDFDLRVELTFTTEETTHTLQTK